MSCSLYTLYFGSFTPKCWLLCLPRDDVLVIKTLALISCLKEISDYKLRRRETCREGALVLRLSGWVKEQTRLLLSSGYGTNLEGEDPGSGLFIHKMFNSTALASQEKSLPASVYTSRSSTEPLVGLSSGDFSFKISCQLGKPSDEQL